MDKMAKRGLALSIFLILGILILMRYNNSYIKVEESIENELFKRFYKVQTRIAHEFSTSIYTSKY